MGYLRDPHLNFCQKNHFKACKGYEKQSSACEDYRDIGDSKGEVKRDTQAQILLEKCVALMGNQFGWINTPITAPSISFMC